MVTALFRDSDTARVRGLWQWDYGQVLRIQGLQLPTAVEIQFSLDETGGEAQPRVGTTKDGVTDVEIPKSMLENEGATSDYNIYAFIYLVDETSGKTIKKIIMYVRARPKTGKETVDTPEDRTLFREAIAEVNKSAADAQNSEKSAEAWVHGDHENYPERDEDNAAYYANQAKEILKDAKKNIDEYVEDKKETLKGDPGTPGADGKSAYQYAKEGGYEGTEEDFSKKLAEEVIIDGKISDLKQYIDDTYSEKWKDSPVMELTLEEEVTSVYVDQINGEAFEFEKLLIEMFSNGATQTENEMRICVAPKYIAVSYAGLCCTSAITKGSDAYAKVELEKVSGVWKATGYSSFLTSWVSGETYIKEHRSNTKHLDDAGETITSFTIIPYTGTLSPGASFKIYGKPARKGATS